MHCTRSHWLVAVRICLMLHDRRRPLAFHESWRDATNGEPVNCKKLRHPKNVSDCSKWILNIAWLGERHRSAPASAPADQSGQQDTSSGRQNEHWEHLGELVPGLGTSCLTHHCPTVPCWYIGYGYLDISRTRLFLEDSREDWFTAYILTIYFHSSSWLRTIQGWEGSIGCGTFIVALNWWENRGLILLADSNTGVVHM